MINILLSGCNGNMGKVISRISENYQDIKISVGYDINKDLSPGYPVFSKLEEIDVPFDVIIDFSHPSALDGLLNFATSRNKPIVISTTGLSNAQLDKIQITKEKIPIFHSSNMSLGVTLLIDLVKKAAHVLGEKYDIEIIEKHHNQKIDAPSGTALMVADAINTVLKESTEYIYDRHSKRKKRSKNEIGIHSVRGGTIVGDHSVIFAGHDEIIEINHIARSKEIFATGAINAARFLHGKTPGIYKMTDIIQ